MLCQVKYKLETIFLELLRLQLVTEFLVSRPRPRCCVCSLFTCAVWCLGGVVVGLEYSGDPPTHSYRGTLEVESCAGAIPPPCTTCYNATIAPPCKHPEGGWVLVGAGGCSPCGRRVPRHPPTQTAQYTARHVPASAGPRRARPGRPPGGEHSCGPRGWRGSTFAGCKCKLLATFCRNNESCGKL